MAYVLLILVLISSVIFPMQRNVISLNRFDRNLNFMQKRSFFPGVFPIVTGAISANANSAFDSDSDSDDEKEKKEDREAIDEKKLESDYKLYSLLVSYQTDPEGFKSIAKEKMQETGDSLLRDYRMQQLAVEEVLNNKICFFRKIRCEQKIELDKRIKFIEDYIPKSIKGE